MNILIIQQRNWSIKFGVFLADELKKRGHKIANISVKESTHNYLLQNGYKKNLWSHDEVINNPKMYLDKCNLNLEEISDYLGINSLWQLIQAQRNLVKSYNEKFYYSFKQNVDDNFIEQYMKSCFGMIDQIFSEFKPDIVISPVLNSFFHAMLNLKCDKENVPIIGSTDSKVDGYVIFTNSYLDNKGNFIDYLNDINKNKLKIDLNSLMEEEEFISNKLKEMKEIKEINLNENFDLNYIKAQLRLFLRSFKYKKNNLGSTQDLTSPLKFIRDFYVSNLNQIRANKFKYDKLEDLKKFVFMPLLMQPEENIDLISTRYNNQIETARQVSMFLPADYCLVVKDHPAMRSKRSISYLNKIKFTPNVKLIDSKIPNWKILEKTNIVVATSGTSVFEASLLGKSTILLGNLGTIKFLPNVHFCERLENLKKIVERIDKTKVDKKETLVQLKKYVHSAFKKGMKYDMWENKIQYKNSLKESLFLMYCKEIKRLTNKSI